MDHAHNEVTERRRPGLSGAQAAALLRLGEGPEDARGRQELDGVHGTTEAPTLLAQPTVEPKLDAPARRTACITLLVLGAAGFSVVVPVDSCEVALNAHGPHGLVQESPDAPAHGAGRGGHGRVPPEESKMFAKMQGVAAATAIGAAMVIGGQAQAQQQAAVQWRVADGGNGHWYVCKRTTWTGDVWVPAQTSAVAIGGHLATLTSAAENQWVYGLTIAQGAWRGKDGPLLGGIKNPDNSFRWANGDSWQYQNWLPGEPSSGLWEPYLMFLGPSPSSTSPTWNDTDGLIPAGSPDSYSYVIEWSADCNNDGIVDYGQCRNGTLPDYDGDNIPDCCERGETCVVGNYPVQWRVEDGGNGHWYQGRRYGPSGTSWTIARNDAIVRGADLVSLNSLQERQWVFAHVASSPALWTTTLGPWVGGMQPPGSVEPGGGWIWVDGSAVYAGFYWNAHHPDGNDDCGGPANRMCYWGDYTHGIGDLFADCADVAHFACWNIDFGNHPSAVVEWSADCNNDGIVDYGQILRGELADANSNGVPDCCDQGVPCNVGVPTPKLKLNAAPTVKVNDTFVVNVDIADLASPAVGAQARVGFDPAKVDFVGVAGGSAFPLLIYSASTANTATFATGVQPGSGSGTTVGNVAQLTFRAKTTLCGDAISAAFATSGFANIVTDSNGHAIPFTPEASVSVTSLAGFSIAGAPVSVSGTACDAGYLGAAVASFTGAAPTANNSCGTALAVSVQVTLPDLTTQSSIPARFPMGASTVVWSASDAAGNMSSVTRTVQVDDRQVLTVAAALDGTSAGDSTRTMSLAYAGGPTGGQSADMPMVNGSGTASGSVDVDITPAITVGPACASIKDVAHSLRKTAAGFGTSGVKWTVDFGTLKQGDSNNDDLVDIRDFGQFVGDYGAGKLAAARSNYNGDTSVDTADYTFISANFFQVGAACGSAWHDTPRSSISVKDLRRMGMGDLAAADINRDGRVDQADIVAFLRGARAGEATRDAGAARGVIE
jgi:hypothetical protein